MTHSSITEKGETILFPLPVAEEDDHTQMSIGGVFVLLLCSSPGVWARCGLFTAIVLLHSTASWLTDWPTADFKNPANRMSVLLLLIAAYCCFLWVCPSIEVIKNRNGMNFNQQLRKKGWNACVLVIELQIFQPSSGWIITVNDTITAPTGTS